MKAKWSIAGSMFLFGSIGLFVRNIACSSAQTALFRGVAGCIFLLAVFFFRKEKIQPGAIKKNLPLLICSGAAVGANWIFLFEAYRYTSVATATLSYYFAPVIVLFLSPVLLKERLTPKKTGCIAAAVLGMFLIAGADIAGTGNLKGILLGLTAAVFYASIILMNKMIKGLSGLTLTMIQLAAASAVLLPYVAATDGLQIHTDQVSIILLFIVGVFHTGIGYFFYFSGVQKVPGQTAAILSYIDPAFAILLSGLFLHETLTFLQLAGGVLVLFAAFLGGMEKSSTAEPLS